MNDLDALNTLRDYINKQEQEDISRNADNFNTDIVLTDKEKETIEKIKAENEEHTAVVVNDIDEQGNAIPQSAQEYTKSLDKRIGQIDDVSNTALKLINSGDIQKTVDDLKNEAKTRAIQTFRSMAKEDEDVKNMSDDAYMDINNAALKTIQDYFKMDRLNSDTVLKELNKLTMQEILGILPLEFTRIYLTDKEIGIASAASKSKLLSIIAYLTTTGPELDYLNEYIEDENKLMLVSKRLMQCQVDFADMIKDEKKMSELIAESHEIEPRDESFWAKYIKIPNMVHNTFAQNAVIYKHYKNAYEKILEEYPEEDTSNVNVRARMMITNEITECQSKIDVYVGICNLDLFKELWDILVNRLVQNKKTCIRSLTIEATETVEKIRRCKQNLPFPGFKGNEKKTDQILQNYLIAFPNMIRNYNVQISKILEKAKDEPDAELFDVAPIHLEGYEDSDVFMVYAMLLLLMMGRVLKKCTKNDTTKYDAIILDSYFQLFCKMGTDVYIMRDIWNIMQNFVKYTLDTWYLPEKKTKGKK